MSDAEARERARTIFDRPLVVEAGAGTGKTTTLIARICTWCIGPGWELARGTDAERAASVLEGVVAITFTEAAAAEMAGRFGEALVEIGAGRPVKGIPELPVAPEDAARRARALLGAVDRLVVSTIHAFCARILGSAPTEAGLHPAHRVDADQTLLADVVHEVVVDWFTEVFSRGGDAMASAGGRERLVRLAEAGIGSEQVVDTLTVLASNVLPPEVLEDDPFPPEAVRRLCAHTLTTLKRILQPVKRAFDGATLDLGKARALHDALDALARTAKAGAPTRETVTLLVERAAAIDRDMLREWARGKFGAHVSRLLAAAAGEVEAAAGATNRLIGHLLRLDPPLLDAARGVLAPLLRRVDAELRRRGIVSFSLLLSGAVELLKKDARLRGRLRDGMTQLLVDEFQDTDALQCELVRMLALEGTRRPGLFLVGDPKQSIYGWRSADLRAYHRFVKSVVAAGGERLHLDVNRRSLSPILDEVERVLAPVMVEASGYQAGFQRLHAHRAGETGPVAPRSSVEHWMTWDADDAGRLRELAADEAAALEARAIATDIVRLREETGLGWEKIGILFRSAGDLEVYMSALRDAGVPYAVERNKQYYRRREIVEAVALVRCVLEPEDTLALLTVLRSAIIGVPDAALLPLWQAHLPERMAALAGDDPAELAELRAIAAGAARAAEASGAPGMDRVSGWVELFVEAVAAIGWLRRSYETLPADRWVAALRDRLPLEAVAAAQHLGEFRLANLQRFYQGLVVELAGADPSAVVRALRTGVAGRREAEEARPGDVAERAVRVMTIHKSKGLDFHHVYLVQLHRGRRDSDGDRGSSVEEWETGWQYQLFGRRTPGYDEVQSHKARVDANERVRLLYVAMTRARDRLVMLGRWPAEPRPVTVETATNLLDLLGFRPDVPTVAEVARAPVRQGDVTWRLADGTKVTARAVIPDSRPLITGDLTTELARRAESEARMARPFKAGASSLAHADLADEPADEERLTSDAGPLAAEVGTAVHLALEHMDPGDPPERALAAAIERVVARLTVRLGGELRTRAIERASRLLARFVKGKLGARFRKVRIVARELPMLSAPGETGPVGFVAGTIDLLARDREGLVVIDYKTDAVGDDGIDARVATYSAQLAVYIRAVEAALGQPTRGELWFLARDEVRAVG